VKKVGAHFFHIERLGGAVEVAAECLNVITVDLYRTHRVVAKQQIFDQPWILGGCHDTLWKSSGAGAIATGRPLLFDSVENGGWYVA